MHTQLTYNYFQIHPESYGDLGALILPLLPFLQNILFLFFFIQTDTPLCYCFIVLFIWIYSYLTIHLLNIVFLPKACSLEILSLNVWYFSDVLSLEFLLTWVDNPTCYFLSMLWRKYYVIVSPVALGRQLSFELSFFFR